MDLGAHIGRELWLEKPTIHYGMYYVHIDYCICGVGYGLLRKPLRMATTMYIHSFGIE